MVYTWDKSNADAPSTRKTQYFEIFGNRAIYHDGWMANTVPSVTPWEGVKGRPPVDVMNGYKWELFNVAEDPTQTNDLSAKEPERLRMMQELWIMEATRNQVFPLNNSQLPILTAERPGPAAGRTQFGYTAPMTSTQFAVAPSILNRSYRITAEIEVPQQGGANGVLVTQGGRFSGWGLYLKDGKPTFTYNLLDVERSKWQGDDALPPGKHTVVFDWKMEARGEPLARGGTGTLSESMGSRWRSGRCPRRSLCSGRGTRLSTSASIRVRLWTTRTTKCRSPSPASWASSPLTSASRASRQRLLSG
jgi:hypothetical protein